MNTFLVVETSDHKAYEVLWTKLDQKCRNVFKTKEEAMAFAQGYVNGWSTVYKTYEMTVSNEIYIGARVATFGEPTCAVNSVWKDELRYQNCHNENCTHHAGVTNIPFIAWNINHLTRAGG